MTSIAFIGLGNMGLPMCHNLIKSGYSVRGFDVSPKACDQAKAYGARVYDAVSEAVKKADVIISMLPSGAIVKDVYLGDDGVLNHARAGVLCIDSSTIAVADARHVSTKAHDAGFMMIDAPVSGGVPGAEAGTLAFMVGGSEPAFEAAKPVLEPMAANIIHAGGNGSGQAAKLCNNMLLAVSMIGTAEAFNLGQALGLDPQVFFDIASNSTGQCWSLNNYCPVPGPVLSSPANRDYQGGFANALMLKDLKLAKGCAEDNSMHTPLGALAANIYDQAVDAGMGHLDFSSIIRYLQAKHQQ